jgi:hypothetical protein
MLRAYSIFDKKSASFNTPFFAINDEVARRSFDDLIRDKRTLVAQHPEDFGLFYIGLFDQETGELTAVVGGAVQVCEGLAAIARVLRYDRDFQTMIKQMTAEPAVPAELSES